MYMHMYMYKYKYIYIYIYRVDPLSPLTPQLTGRRRVEDLPVDPHNLISG